MLFEISMATPTSSNSILHFHSAPQVLLITSEIRIFIDL
jgi:hypothetical protein